MRAPRESGTAAGRAACTREATIMSGTTRRQLLALACIAASVLVAGQAAAQRTLVMYCGVDEKWCRSMAD